MMALRLSLGLLAFAGVGSVIDVVAFRRHPLRSPTPWLPRLVIWVLLGLAALYVVSLRSIVALLLVTAVLWAPRLRAFQLSLTATLPKQANPSWLLGVLIVTMGLWIFARPLVPLAWDEFVWIGKAQIEGREGFGGLRAAALLPGLEVFPAGYPLLWSLLPAWLVRTDDLAALSLGFSALRLLCFCAFALALHAAALLHVSADQPSSLIRERRVLMIGAAATALMAPLFFEHMRLMYADAAVGLLAAALTLTFLSQSQFQRRLAVAASVVPAFMAPILSIVLCGLKDEGVGHVAAVSVMALLFGGRSMRVMALCSLGTATVVTGCWRYTLASHSIENTDHAMGIPAVTAFGSLLSQLFEDATDPLSWGLLWPLAVGAGAWLLLARRRHHTESGSLSRAEGRFVAAALFAQAAMLQGALLLGPEVVRVFALNGTLINRMLVQLTPAAAVVLLAFAQSWRCAEYGSLRASSEPTTRRF